MFLLFPHPGSSPLFIFSVELKCELLPPLEFLLLGVFPSLFVREFVVLLLELPETFLSFFMCQCDSCPAV